MKKLFSIFVLTLAANFLAVAGGAGWLVKSGHLDKAKAMAIKDLLFPKPEAAPASQPAADPSTQPTMKLDELLAQKAGRPATEQIEFIQHTFDAQMVQLDRRQRELNDLQRQVELAKQQMARDRALLVQDRTSLDAQRTEETKLASDKGFQDCLQRYQAMPGKQVKSIFLTLDDKVIVQYLQAMEPRAAAKVIKEFKTPDELTRVQRVLEMMRQSTPAPDATAPQAQTATGLAP